MLSIHSGFPATKESYLTSTPGSNLEDINLVYADYFIYINTVCLLATSEVAWTLGLARTNRSSRRFTMYLVNDGHMDNTFYTHI